MFYHGCRVYWNHLYARLFDVSDSFTIGKVREIKFILHLIVVKFRVKTKLNTWRKS